MKNNLFIIVGRSCVGKTTTLLKVVDYFKDLHECVSHTTRKKRNEEINGIHYNFVSEDFFVEGINSGCMVEYVKYNNNYYGLSYKSFSDEMDNIVIVEPSGLNILREKLSDRYNIIVIKMDEPDNVIEDRFVSRGDTVEDAKRRMKNDKKIFKNVEYDYLINSDEEKLKEIILESRLNNVTKYINDRYDNVLLSIHS